MVKSKYLVCYIYFSKDREHFQEFYVEQDAIDFYNEMVNGKCPFVKMLEVKMQHDVRI